LYLRWEIKESVWRVGGEELLQFNAIASFLNITPQMLFRIRKEVTLGMK
jgi:hypothetical protein